MRIVFFMVKGRFDSDLVVTSLAIVFYEINFIEIPNITHCWVFYNSMKIETLPKMWDY